MIYKNYIYIYIYMYIYVYIYMYIYIDINIYIYIYIHIYIYIYIYKHIHIWTWIRKVCCMNIESGHSSKSFELFIWISHSSPGATSALALSRRGACSHCARAFTEGFANRSNDRIKWPVRITRHIYLYMYLQNIHVKIYITRKCVYI